MREICDSTPIHNSDAILWDDFHWIRLGIGDIWDSLCVPGSMPSWFSFVWCKFTVPKYAFTTWLVVQEKLLTKDRMHNFHTNTNLRCVFCGFHTKTHRHIFCQCPLIRQIFAIWNWSITTTWSDFIAGNVCSHTGLSNIEIDITYLFVSVVLFMIWRERNSRIHNSNIQPSGVSNLILEIKRVVRRKLASCNFFSQSLRQNPMLIIHLYLFI